MAHLDEKKDVSPPGVVDAERGQFSDDESVHKGDLLSLEAVDPVLNAKMHLVNNAIDEIGFTPYHWKLFCLNGFGYAVDSLILLIQSIIAGAAANEFNPSFAYGMTIAAYVGMLVGALFWGLSADVIGRKYAFNLSLLISSIFCIVAGASPNWVVLGLFVSLASFGSGGNLVLDTAVFLEYLPSSKQWLLTLMASWWGIGQFIAGLFAWAYMPNFSCDPDAGEECNWNTNPGWRYVWFTSGALVFVMSIARITVIRLRETPKFLVGEGRDAEVVDTMQYLANRYGRNCSLTLEGMEACGITGGGVPEGRRGSVSAHAKKKWSFSEIGMHLKGLFATKKMGLSTSLIWFSWLLIGLAYPLYVLHSPQSICNIPFPNLRPPHRYNVFLPVYLETRGAQLGGLSESKVWQYYAASNLASVPSPILAGFMCNSRYFWGRRGTMIIGGLVTMAFFFAYTQVRTNAQNTGFTCAISFCLVSFSTLIPSLLMLFIASQIQTFSCLTAASTRERIGDEIDDTCLVWVASLQPVMEMLRGAFDNWTSGWRKINQALSGWRAYSPPQTRLCGAKDRERPYDGGRTLVWVACLSPQPAAYVHQRLCHILAELYRTARYCIHINFVRVASLSPQFCCVHTPAAVPIPRSMVLEHNTSLVWLASLRPSQEICGANHWTFEISTAHASPGRVVSLRLRFAGRRQQVDHAALIIKSASATHGRLP